MICPQRIFVEHLPSTLFILGAGVGLRFWSVLLLLPIPARTISLVVLCRGHRRRSSTPPASIKWREPEIMAIHIIKGGIFRCRTLSTFLQVMGRACAPAVIPCTTLILLLLLLCLFLPSLQSLAQALRQLRTNCWSIRTEIAGTARPGNGAISTTTRSSSASAPWPTAASSSLSVRGCTAPETTSAAAAACSHCGLGEVEL
mmetsp:Transcript_2985/g.5392  ORF Transcript_2985/g.5392 Transcript_2985/m.5392 type:complete len:201 (+) Transcript_2985:408-1010(+)